MIPILIRISIFDVDLAHEAFDVKECYTIHFGALKPLQIGINIGWELHSLLSHLLVTHFHDIFVNKLVGHCEDVVVHSILAPKHRDLLRMLLTQLLEK